ncbi:MAG: hypothetical protein FWC40_01040 [Proteobacteria bacterium]|nr:hypothetical protein [Pseudomonadota bacterium]
MSKMAIHSMETGIQIEADFNPRELSFTKPVGWSDDNAGISTNFPSLQFTAGKAITMSVELLFDRYEQEQDVRPIIGDLMQLTLVDENLGRPPLVMALWNGNDRNLYNGPGGEFTGVVDSVATKYTMFLPDGRPCRATATVALKQATEVSVAVANGGGPGSKTVAVTSAAQLTAIPNYLKLCGEQNVNPTGPFPVTLNVPTNNGNNGNGNK